MRRPRYVLALGGLLISTLAGCGHPGATIPPDAQVIHLVATEAEVHLTPATAHAGDIYVQLDEPRDDGSFQLVQRKRTAAEAPGPMDDDALERLAHGDTEGTSMEGFGPSCSGQGANIGILVQEGICGNVWMLVLGPGKYAILGPAWTMQETEARVDPTANPAGFEPPRTMTVLEVVP